jgi:ferredoxin-NADP reductase
VTGIQPESDIIRSFYLEPREGEDLPCHRAGQFLPIEVLPPGAQEPVQRTYTISNAPNGAHYRLSIKREPPGAPGVAPGIASNLFHDHFRPGTTIRALSPRGQFTLDTSSTRPVVLISAGVGITPMISMLQQLDRDRATCGCTRKVWFIHGDRNAAEQAFGDFVRDVAANWPNLTTHFRFSRPADDDVTGRDYDSTGRVDVQLLKSLLPFDDYEFYLCGPAAFMEAIYQDLKDLSIADDRIHYEYFGPGKTLSSSRSGSSAATRLKGKSPVPVQFAKSGIEVTWDPDKGTLLDLAESEGLEPAYSCRSGVCQTCAVAVLSGSAEYLDQPTLPPPEGMALICSAYPVTDPDDHEPGPIILDI